MQLTEELPNCCASCTVELTTPVFTNLDGTPIEPKTFLDALVRVCASARDPDARLYCARDALVSLALTAGVNDDVSWSRKGCLPMESWERTADVGTA